jgi:hypothetical protein
MTLVQIPSDISVVAGNAGELISTGPKHHVVMEMDYGSDLWNGGSCSIRLWSPPGSLPINAGNLGGVPWKVSVDGWQRFTGFLQGVSVERTMGGYMRTFTLRDCLQAWDVLLTTKTYPDPPTVSATYKVTDALADMISTVATKSGIPAYGATPQNAALVTDMYEDGIMEINNSTYLAEIQRICQNLGFRAFCDCAFEDVRLLDVAARPNGSFVPDETKIISAAYSMDATSIPATVFASDDSLGKGIAYGKWGTPPNWHGGNFAATGIDNLTWASTVGIAEDHLADIAKKTYDLARGGSKNLTLVVADHEPTRRMIGLGVVWGVGDAYFLYSHHTHISASEYKTTYQAWGT